MQIQLLEHVIMNLALGPHLLIWISNYIHYKMWDEITYPFQNMTGGLDM